MLDFVELTQKTCADLYSLYGERAVWTSLLFRYQVTLQPRTHWLDRPLRYYDAKELQQLVLQPFKVDRALKSENPTISLKGAAQISNAWIRNAELIQGGRWFILGSVKGDVLYINLESPDLHPRELIPSPYDPSHLVLPSISIDMDDEAPYLTFNLALIAPHYPPYQDKPNVQDIPIRFSLTKFGRLQLNQTTEAMSPI